MTNCNSKVSGSGTGEMARQLGALLALQGDWSSIPSIHVGQLTIPVTLALGHPTPTHIHATKIKFIFF